MPRTSNNLLYTDVAGVDAPIMASHQPKFDKVCLRTSFTVMQTYELERRMLPTNYHAHLCRKASTGWTRATCTMIIVHVSCPSALTFHVIESGGSLLESRGVGAVAGKPISFGPNTKKCRPVKHQVVETRDKMILPNHRISSYRLVFVDGIETRDPAMNILGFEEFCWDETSSERSIERSSDQAMERSIGQSGERSSDRSTDRSSDRAVDRAIERSSDRAVDPAIDRAIERTIKRSIVRAIGR